MVAFDTRDRASSISAVIAPIVLHVIKCNFSEFCIVGENDHFGYFRHVLYRDGALLGLSAWAYQVDRNKAKCKKCNDDRESEIFSHDYYPPSSEPVLEY